jgi:hypothetical protein
LQYLRGKAITQRRVENFGGHMENWEGDKYITISVLSIPIVKMGDA